MLLACKTERVSVNKQFRSTCTVLPTCTYDLSILFNILVPRAYDLLVNGWIVQQFKKNRWGSGDENDYSTVVTRKGNFTRTTLLSKTARDQFAQMVALGGNESQFPHRLFLPACTHSRRLVTGTEARACFLAQVP